MVRRRGAGSMGCLIPLLIVALVVYLGRGLGEASFRYYRMSDRMQQEAQYGEIRGDDAIAAQLRSIADSLGLPPAAGAVHIVHTPEGLTIWSEYDEVVPLPFGKEKTLHFKPSTGGRF